MLTIYLYVIIPKGFFPIQDTGVIQGISEANQDISFPEMSKRQQELAAAILKNPAVESLSSFIGVDGTNTTMSSGRIQINLKPLEDRGKSATRCDPASCSLSWRKIDGITLYMQPVQDLSVEDSVSRTEYQYTLEDPDASRTGALRTRFVDKLKTLPELADVASDLRSKRARSRDHDRPPDSVPRSA